MSTSAKQAGVPSIAPNQAPQSNSTLQVQTPEKMPFKGSFKDIVEKIQGGNQKLSFYNNFSKRLDEIKEFRGNHSGEALTLTIANDETEISFNNLEMILAFVDNAIDKGEQAKEKFETELMITFA